MNLIASLSVKISTWKLKSPTRSKLSEIVASNSSKMENSLKNISKLRPFFLFGRGLYTTSSRKEAEFDEIVKSPTSNDLKLGQDF